MGRTTRAKKARSTTANMHSDQVCMSIRNNQYTKYSFFIGERHWSAYDVRLV